MNAAASRPVFVPSFDLSYAEATSLVFAGPVHPTVIAINGVPYTGAHTRRAIRSAMTRAGTTVCTINGQTFNAAGLGYCFDLA